MAEVTLNGPQMCVAQLALLQPVQGYTSARPWVLGQPTTITTGATLQQLEGVHFVQLTHAHTQTHTHEHTHTLYTTHTHCTPHTCTQPTAQQPGNAHRSSREMSTPVLG